MQGQPIKTSLNLSTHLTDSFDNAHDTKTVEDNFCAYPKSFLSNKNQRVIRLTDRDNEEI